MIENLIKYKVLCTYVHKSSHADLTREDITPATNLPLCNYVTPRLTVFLFIFFQREGKTFCATHHIDSAGANRKLCLLCLVGTHAVCSATIGQLLSTEYSTHFFFTVRNKRSQKITVNKYFRTFFFFFVNRYTPRSSV